MSVVIIVNFIQNYKTTFFHNRHLKYNAHLFKKRSPQNPPQPLSTNKRTIPNPFYFQTGNKRQTTFETRSRKFPTFRGQKKWRRGENARDSRRPASYCRLTRPVGSERTSKRIQFVT